MRPKISVIIPIYNTALYLDRCITSVLNQTLREIEVICIDDCSPDDSYMIVDKYMKHDSRISLIRHHCNKGLGAARNTGILAAKADFLASVDSDDYIKPDMLQTLWDASEDEKYDVVCGGYDCVDKNGTRLNSYNLSPKKIQSEVDAIDIFSIVNPAFWNKLWKKSLFVDNNIFFPDRLYFEDLATTPRLLAKSKNIKLIEGTFYCYLIRPNSITNCYSQRHISDFISVFIIVLEFLKSNQLLKKHKNSFINMVNMSIYNHAKNFISLGSEGQEEIKYLSQLYLQKNKFLERNLVIKATCHTYKSNTYGTVKNKKRLLFLLSPRSSLSSIQLLFLKVFSFVIKIFLAPKQQQKLREDPISFFNDSQSKIIRAVGTFLKVPTQFV